MHGLALTFWVVLKISSFITSYYVNKKVQLDATVCRHLFTAQSLYMFQVSQHPSSGVLKTVSATSGIGHDDGTATSFHRGLIRNHEFKKKKVIMFSKKFGSFAVF